MNQKESQDETSQLSKIKQSIIYDVKQHLEEHKFEVLPLRIFKYNTMIGEDFFDDFLGERVSIYMPVDLKNILDLCMEEPNIIGEIARFTSSDPTTLTIIKEAIRFYLKDYVYGKMQELIKDIQK